MDYSQLTDEELAALPPELLQEVLAEIEAQKQAESPVPQLNEAPPQEESGYRDVEVADGMHPGIDVLDRLVVKNFASNPEAGIGYMQKKYPGMQFMRTRDGEIVAKSEADPHWYRLDEKGLSLKDIGDVGFDVAQGIGEGLALAKGTLATLPVGGWGGIVARGAVGAAGEAAKQGIGSALGIPDNYDIGNVGISGTASAALPVVGEKVVAPVWGLTKKYAPKVMSAVSGYDEDMIRNLNVDKNAREKISDIGPDSYAADLYNKLRAGFKNAEVSSGQAVGATQNPTGIDISAVKRKLQGDLANLTPEEAPRYSQAADVLAGANDVVSPADVFRYKNELYKVGQKGQTPIARSSGATGSEQMRSLLEQNATDPAAFKNAMDAHSELMKTKGNDMLRPVLKNENKALDQLATWYTGKKANNPALNTARSKLSKKVDNYTGVDLDKSAREMESWKVFAPENSSWSNNNTALLKVAPQLGAGVGYGAAALSGGSLTGIGPLLGAAAGAGFGQAAKSITSSNAIKAYAAASPWIDKTGRGVRYIYANPYIRLDKTLNNIANENER